MSIPATETNYNDLLLQISTNLRNTLNTFGASSHQYQAVLQSLKDLLQRIEQGNALPVKPPPPDPDMLSQAMEFLNLEE
ncbi:hypothetical protein UA08_07219 [Talaromyces atroroseus]|uniref:Uncharacterized protein n=1 Tax=Talaromyces atroroseus TaxID=1441469 RepID=A0A225AVF1_TALAT|nr:hypothetical protein UA08_07219 [Talaromyces atroroseus]OKL57457.1 hypothetical protein UA08_07219 [Talaromyces atroroseus]